MSTFRIATWNTQGNAFGEGKMNHLISAFNPDIICLQECGNLDGTSVVFQRDSRVGQIRRGTYEHGTRNGIKYEVLFYPWRGASRCSMAVLVKSTLAISDYSLVDYNIAYNIDEPDEVDVSETTEGDDEEDYVEARKCLRSMLRVDIKHNDDIISINNVHLPSGRPGFARKVGSAFINKCCSYRHRYFIMIGDMNTLPNSWDGQFSRLISAPEDYTHSGKNTLDYMFTNMQASVLNIDDGFHSSDHLSVIYEIQLS